MVNTKIWLSNLRISASSVSQYLTVLLTSVLFIHSALAQSISENDIDAFIQRVKTVTYDCPNPDTYQELKRYLSRPELSSAQRFALQVEQTHFLICEGKATEAQALLNDIVAKSDVDTDTYFYASAIYQIGFIFDVKEQPERCGYYQQAKALANNKYDDVFLSASLGLITNCLPDKDAAERLGMMFGIVQSYSNSDNYQALAHIHNSIGLMYGSLEQHVLAAEQYLKAHEMGKRVYTGSNQLSILISAITSLFASGDFERAYETIQEFKRINGNVNTPLTNYFYHHALTGYYYRIGDIDSMKAALPDLQQNVQGISNPLVQAMAKWYAVVPCVADQDLACIHSYLDSSDNVDNAQRYFSANIDYLKLKVDMYLALGELEQVKGAFDEYSSRLNDRTQKRQSASSILSAADVYTRIYDLEAQIAQEQTRKRNMLIMIAGIALVLILAVAWMINRKLKSKLTLDPTTQLLNADAAFNQITKLDTPAEGKTHALAIFDLKPFRQIVTATQDMQHEHVIQRLAYALKEVTRESDIAGRLSVEQFVLCLPHIEERIAKSLFDRVHKALNERFSSHSQASQLDINANMSVYISTGKLSNLTGIMDDLALSLNVMNKQTS